MIVCYQLADRPEKIRLHQYQHCNGYEHNVDSYFEDKHHFEKDLLLDRDTWYESHTRVHQPSNDANELFGAEFDRVQVEFEESCRPQLNNAVISIKQQTMVDLRIKFLVVFEVRYEL